MTACDAPPPPRRDPSRAAPAWIRPGPPARRRFLAWLGGAVVAGRAAAAGSQASPQGGTPIGQILEDGPLQGLNGPSRRLGDFRGQPLIINVWASWCGPCRQEMASLERLAWREGGPRLNIIGISTDDDAGMARRMLASTNATLSHFIDSRLYWETRLGASRLPLTVFVDAHGRVLDKVYGSRQWDGPDAARDIDRRFGRRSPSGAP